LFPFLSFLFLLLLLLQVILPTVPLLPLLALTDLLTTGGTRHNVRVEEVMEVAKELKVVVGEVSRKRKRVEEFESELTEGIGRSPAKGREWRSLKAS